MSLSPRIFFPPHKSLPPQLPPLNIQHCDAGNVSQTLCLLHQKEGNFFSNLVQQKFSTKCCCFLLRDKLGDNIKSGDLQGSVGGDGVWKESLCRKHQASPIALVRCKSPFKECLRPSLRIRPPSLPKHSSNVGKEEEVSTKDPQEFPH